MTLTIRWYHWCIAIVILGLVALGITIALQETAYRATERQRFVEICTNRSASGASARHCECMWREMRRSRSIPVLSDFVLGAPIPADIAQEIARERDRAFLICR